MTLKNIRYPAWTRDRFMVFLMMATALHVAVVFGIGFGISLTPPPRLADILDVVLVQWRSEDEPDQPDYLALTPEKIDIPNVVTAVLASFRGYDTLGETVVIFSAGIAVMLMLGLVQRFAQLLEVLFQLLNLPLRGKSRLLARSLTGGQGRPGICQLLFKLNLLVLQPGQSNLLLGLLFRACLLTVAKRFSRLFCALCS